MYLNELHDAASVMRQLADWFEDYNGAPAQRLADAVTQGVQESDRQRLGSPVRRGQLQQCTTSLAEIGHSAAHDDIRSGRS